MANTMNISLRKTGECTFEMDDGRGHTTIIDGPEKLGGTDAGPRPMEMFLASLASCSAVDVVMILKQQKQPLEDLHIEVHGERVDAIPAVFAKIHLHFKAYGNVAANKMQRAVNLSVEKYCSVARMLVPDVIVEHTAEVVPAAE